VIEHEERELIESIIEFGDTVAREIMVPRPDMVAVEHDATVTEALDVAIEHGFSRLPILGGGDEDDVIGLAYIKDLIRAEREGGREQGVVDLMRPVRFIPENKPVAHLMREMQAEKYHLALVVDEYGGIAGLISLEDCLEELVGEIVDEFDDEMPAVELVQEGQYLIDGGFGISDLNELLSLHLPDQDWDTVAGFVFNTLGHVPLTGESVEFDGWRFVVELMEGRRIRRVRVTSPARLMGIDSVDADAGRTRD
jgi:putative hemolysin